jgi:hypothetical protein
MAFPAGVAEGAGVDGVGVAVVGVVVGVGVGVELRLQAVRSKSNPIEPIANNGLTL